MKHIFIFVCLIVFSYSTLANQVEGKTTKTKNPIVVLHTNNGDITIELYPDKAPVSVANFLNYARSGFYNGTIFHRVIKRFMIQGGGFTQELVKKNTKAPIINESKNGLHNDRWSIAMARTNDPDSATAQFYINVAMNSQLDSRQGNPGYAVFGMVIDGQYAVKAIEKIATQAIGIHANVPVQAVIIQSVDIQ